MREPQHLLSSEKESTGKLSFSDLEVSWISEEFENHSITVITFRGRIDDKNSFSLNQKFYKIPEFIDENSVILNLSELSYVNSAGLAILHSLISRLRNENFNLAIGGMHPFLSKIFSLIESFPGMKVFDSCDEAKKSHLWQYHL